MNPDALQETASMSQCIPMLSMTGTFLSSQILPLRGKWEALRQRRLNVTDFSVRDQERADVSRLSDPDIDMHRQPWPIEWNVAGQEKQAPQGDLSVAAATAAEVAATAADVAATAAAAAVAGEAVPHPQQHGNGLPQQGNAPYTDDDMLSWLHYPIEEHFERGYCSEIFGDVPSSTMPQDQNVAAGGNREAAPSASLSSQHVRFLPGLPDAEAAMALGAKRAAGLSSQAGLEAFCKVRTSIQPPVPKWPTTLTNSTTERTSGTSTQEVVMDVPSSLPPTKTLENNNTSFKQFTVPTTPKKRNNNVHVSSSFGGESVASYHRKEAEIVQRSSPKTEPDSLMSVGGSSTSWRTKSVDTDTYQRKTSPTQKKYEAAEPTLTSSSGGSENTYDRAVLPAEKRKARDMTESVECQSEELEAESIDTKKPASNRPKRSRAAEVHNLSERRRRDRINEKMRALQELIPNSNKTDKASMLDEAIEYLKMLQLQLQMMSMRSGMNLPPMVMSSGLQPMQVPQMAAMPYGVTMGMGIPVNMSMGVSMLDMAGTSAGVRTAASLGEVSDPPAPQAFSPYTPQQVPLQHVLNREMYNAYMLPVAHNQQFQQPQQQQQQQQQLQLLPPQQMQLQIHPSNAFHK